jgi:hypothetical protein
VDPADLGLLVLRVAFGLFLAAHGSDDVLLGGRLGDGRPQLLVRSRPVAA